MNTNLRQVTTLNVEKCNEVANTSSNESLNGTEKAVSSFVEQYESQDDHCSNQPKRKRRTELEKATEELERMKKKKMAQAVIDAQEAEIERLQANEECTRQNELLSSQAIDENRSLTFSVVDRETSSVRERSYKVGFVKNNRPIDHKKVDGFIRTIANGRYEPAYPIIAALASDLMKKGYTVLDVKGNVVTKENSLEYLVILDGQHRALSFLKCESETHRVVPNTIIKNVENVGDYLVSINDVGSSWTTKDRFAVAALTSKDELAQVMADRIREGFNPTTASIIYTGKKITKAQINKVLKGESLKLPKDAVVNINRGDRFIHLCKEAGMSVKLITKRYFIEGFNDYVASIKDEYLAFEALKNLKNKNHSEDTYNRIRDNADFIMLLA